MKKKKKRADTTNLSVFRVLDGPASEDKGSKGICSTVFGVTDRRRAVLPREVDAREVDCHGHVEGLGKTRCKAPWNREFEFPWREAGPPNHHDDQVDSDQ